MSGIVNAFVSVYVCECVEEVKCVSEGFGGELGISLSSKDHKNE